MRDQPLARLVGIASPNRTLALSARDKTLLALGARISRKVAEADAHDSYGPLENAWFLTARGRADMMAEDHARREDRFRAALDARLRQHFPDKTERAMAKRRFFEIGRRLDKQQPAVKP